MVTSENTLPKIASCWRGHELGWMQLACLASFVKAGHEVTLYSDNTKLRVPEGVRLQSTEEIWPQDKLYQVAPSVLFSDIFRLKLLQKSPVIWVDTDAYCTKPFEGFPPHLFGMLGNGVATGILGLPENSPILNDLLAFALEGRGFPSWLSKARQEQAKAIIASNNEARLLALYQIKNGFLGPNALTYYAKLYDLAKEAQRPIVFYPVPPTSARSLFIEGSAVWMRAPRVKSVHFYGRNIGELAFHSDPASFPPGSFAARAYHKTKNLWQTK